MVWGGQKVRILRFSLNFQIFSFVLHSVMEIFPFVFYHPLESVDPCFKNSYKGFLSVFVENLGHRAFYALPVRNVVFGEFSLDIAKKAEITWCEAWAVSRVRHPLDYFA
jgi:hypothetical protein